MTAVKDWEDWVKLRTTAALGSVAREHATSIAVRTPDSSMTFAELDDLVARVSTCLAAELPPQSRVVIAYDRSSEAFAAAHAVLRAGMVMVPVNPNDPERRNRAIIDSIKPACILASSAFGGADSGWETVDLASLRSSRRAAPPVVQEADTAYVLHTSGSTGVPKGVAVGHAALDNYLAHVESAYLGHGNGTLLYSPLAFDFTMTALFGGVMAAQTTLIVDGGYLPTLLQAIEECRDLTFLKVTPSLLRVMGSRLDPKTASALTRCLVVGGEALYGRHILPFMGHQECKIVNEYGPTEATVGCVAYEVDRSFSKNDPIPIGKPISGASVEVVDADGGSVPVGHRGEIRIGGKCLADGYLIDEPEGDRRFKEVNGRKLFSTRDMASVDENGILTYYGRSDDQLKVRGHRVEPTEIEAAMRELPDVHDVAVANVYRSDGSAVLCAFYVSAYDLNLASVTTDLSQVIPTYMIPSRFIRLGSIPISDNGKIARSELRALAINETVQTP